MMIFKKKYPTSEALYLALKANESDAYSNLQEQIEPMVAKMCREYQLNNALDDILQETCTQVFVNLEMGTYLFRKDTAPKTYAIGIAKYKISEWKRKLDKLPTDSIDDDINAIQIADNQDITDWAAVDAVVKHLYEQLDETSAQLIWLRTAEGKSYEDIEPLMPEFKHRVSLRNKWKKCWDKWMELLKKDGFK
jgi:DNA-directed RNA polymerase specialized sigma24 family protein